ncbi:potassium-transporting ATPase subunit KdpA, partial [Escherichia coli]|nr:potassium-transporting ATPase subunit KdpA [Escherichia coli]
MLEFKHSFCYVLWALFGLIAQLAIAGSLLAKNTQENTANSLKTDNLTFMFVLVCIIYIFAALTFFPVLTLSSVA